MNITNSIYKHLLLSILICSLAACGVKSPTPSSTNAPTRRSTTQLVLNNAILEQSSDRQNLVWKIKSNSTIYSKDREVAKLTGVTANLLQNDQLILQISAESGEVRDEGNLVLLQQQIIVQDTRNGAVVKTEQIEWQPQENLLIIPAKLTATHPNLEVKAEGGKYSTDSETLELQGKVKATAMKPALQLTSDRLMWQIPSNKVISPSSLQIVRYQPDRTVSDRLVADTGEIDLNQKIATLNQNIELVSLNPQLQIATDNLTWDYQNRIAKTVQPIQIIDRQNKLDITGNRGTIDFNQQIARLDSGVHGINRQQLAELYARELIWNIKTEVVEATGNVTYQQTNPQVRSTGEKAVGKLKENNIILSDGKNKRKQVTSVIRNPN